MTVRHSSLSAALLASSLCFAGCGGSDDTNAGNNGNPAGGGGGGTTTQTSNLKGSKPVQTDTTKMTVDSPLPVKVKGVTGAKAVSFEVKGALDTIPEAVLKALKANWVVADGSIDLDIDADDTIAALGVLELSAPPDLVAEIKGLKVDVEGMLKPLTITASNGAVTVEDAKDDVKLTTKNGDAKVTSSEAVNIELQVEVAGNATVDAPKASKIDVTVEKGNISVTTDAVESSETTLRLTDSGAVQLSLPTALSATLDVKAAALTSSHSKITVTNPTAGFNDTVGSGDADITVEAEETGSTVTISEH